MYVEAPGGFEVNVGTEFPRGTYTWTKPLTSGLTAYIPGTKSEIQAVFDPSVTSSLEAVPFKPGYIVTSGVRVPFVGAFTPVAGVGSGATGKGFIGMASTYSSVPSSSAFFTPEIGLVGMSSSLQSTSRGTYSFGSQVTSDYTTPSSSISSPTSSLVTSPSKPSSYFQPSGLRFYSSKGNGKGSGKPSPPKKPKPTPPSSPGRGRPEFVSSLLREKSKPSISPMTSYQITSAKLYSSTPTKPITPVAPTPTMVGKGRLSTEPRFNVPSLSSFKPKSKKKKDRWTAKADWADVTRTSARGMLTLHPVKKSKDWLREVKSKGFGWTFKGQAVKLKGGKL